MAENTLSGHRPWYNAETMPHTMPMEKPRAAPRTARTKVFFRASRSWPQTGVALNTDRPKSPRMARNSQRIELLANRKYFRAYSICGVTPVRSITEQIQLVIVHDTFGTVGGLGNY